MTIDFLRKYSLVKINCNAGQQNAILPLCSLFTSYNCTVGTKYFMWAPLAPSKLFNCFTIAVYCRRKVVTVNYSEFYYLTARICSNFNEISPFISDFQYIGWKCRSQRSDISEIYCTDVTEIVVNGRCTHLVGLVILVDR